MMKAPLAILCVLLLPACGTKSGEAGNPDLRSDMPARSVAYYTDHRTELTDMEKVCAAWQASQQPVATWPAVVSGNCNNVNAAKTVISNHLEIDKLRKEAGS